MNSKDFTTNEQAWTAAAGWASEDRMNELETLMWRSERHPTLSSTITALLVLDRAPGWDRLYAAHEWATKLVPRCRQRVLEPALPVGPPAWVPDHDFHLDYHLRRTRLPRPGTMAQLLHLVQANAMAPFDRTRPLWEGLLIEGLDGDRAAYLLKLHHSLTDGMGGIQLLSLVQSRTREHTPDKPVSTITPAEREPDPFTLAVDELSEQLRNAPRLARRLWSVGRHALTHPADTASGAVRFAGSMRRTLTPPPAPPSPLLRGRTGRAWRFGVLECGLAELKAAGKAGGGSVNDAYVAALLGGLRRYHDEHSTEIDELPMAMPLSLRKADDPMGGNRFAGALFAAPVGIADPAERIASIRGTVLSVRTEPALDTFSMVAPVLNRMPSSVGAAFGRMGGSADLSASSVPGLPYAVYMAGAKVERLFPFGPLPGVALMAAMVSHVDTCCVGINYDGHAITDHDLLMRCMAEGVDEVLALAEGT